MPSSSHDRSPERPRRSASSGKRRDSHSYSETSHRSSRDDRGDRGNRDGEEVLSSHGRDRTGNRDRHGEDRERRGDRRRRRDLNKDVDVDRYRDHSRRDRRDSEWKDRERRRDRSRERRRDRDRDGTRDQDQSERRRRDSHRDPSRSPEGRRRRDLSPAGSESSEELLDLAELGVRPITDEDYFLKASEFRFWLKEERGRYLDELSSESAHKYFRRFVRRWNDGVLPRSCYTAHESTSVRASENTAYKWSFAGHRSRVNSQELAAARADVDRMTHAKGLLPAPTRPGAGTDSDDEVGPRPAPRSASVSPGPKPGGAVGPSMPTVSERQLAREAAAEEARDVRSAERKATRKSAYERADEAVPRASGREGKMADRKAQNEENRKYRDKDMAAGLEVDEGTLLGDDGGFAAALRARDAAEGRRVDRKAEYQAEMRSAAEERLAERRQKEAASMDMLKQMAKQRFG